MRPSQNKELLKQLQYSKKDVIYNCRFAKFGYLYELKCI